MNEMNEIKWNKMEWAALRLIGFVFLPFVVRFFYVSEGVSERLRFSVLVFWYFGVWEEGKKGSDKEGRESVCG